MKNKKEQATAIQWLTAFGLVFSSPPEIITEYGISSIGARISIFCAVFIVSPLLGWLVVIIANFFYRQVTALEGKKRSMPCLEKQEYIYSATDFGDYNDYRGWVSDVIALKTKKEMKSFRQERWALYKVVGVAIIVHLWLAIDWIF